MTKGAKIIVTVGIVIGFFFVFAAITYSSNKAGNATPGIISLILFIGAIAGIRAVWKKSDNNNDSHQLDKTN